MPSTTSIPRRPLQRFPLAVLVALVAWAVVFSPVALQTAHDHGFLPCGHDRPHGHECGTTRCATATVSPDSGRLPHHLPPVALHVCTACFLLGAAKADQAASAPLPPTTPRVFPLHEELGELSCSPALAAPLARGPPSQPDRTG